MQYASEYFESAMGWLERGNRSAALAHLQQGLLLDPDNASAWANRGNILMREGRPFDALVSLERALSLMPDAWELYVNKAAALAELNRHDEAMKVCEQAERLAPDEALVQAEKANLYYVRGDYLPAAECYRKALASSSVFPEQVPQYHLFRGMALLAAGEYREGWAEYEWRYQNETYTTRNLPCPQWDGQDGANVLVLNEQGLGDTLQFMRLAQTLKQRHGGKVYLEVRSPLLRIARTLAGIDQVIAFGDRLPNDIQYMTSAMSLPHRLKLWHESDIPSGPYLSGKGERERLWRERLGRGGLKVGICWAGEARTDIHLLAIDARRSLPLALLEPLSRIAGVSLISLQVGKEASQVYGVPFRVAHLSNDIEDFYDTAALIECLDLVISVDTSVAHLAGALGKPTWLLSRFDNCWRWLGEREDSPWYPTLRQFRQRKWGDWPEVINRVAAALLEHVAMREAA